MEASEEVVEQQKENAVQGTDESAGVRREELIEGEPLLPCHPDDDTKPAPFGYITENLYLTERTTSREGKRAKRMVCDCQFDPEVDDPSEACGENCLNRLLMIECGSRCPCGEYCNNKRFQRCQYACVEVFRTDHKGWGLQAMGDIPADTFVMEYCGEVCTLEEFEQRKKDYRKDKRRHYYFMSLKTDEILDATRKGNLSRFINHSCDPNCETQKWTVGGKLRVGFFTVRKVSIGDELTFDYKFQRFGEAAQKCFCGSANCRGYLGAPKQPENRLLGLEGGVPSPTGKEGRRRGRGRGDADSMFEKQVYDIVGPSWRLKDVSQVLAFSRLMLQAESLLQRGMLLRVLQTTEDTNCLKRFLSLHGLRLLWSWMVELTDTSSKQVLDTRMHVLHTLSHLPIHNKNLLNDNKILPVVKKWAEPKAAPPPQQQSDSEQQSPAVTVREADCSQGGEGGGEGGGREEEEEEEDEDMDEEEEGVLCEAEARESGDSTDMARPLEEEEEMMTAASELLSKWSHLKEVFRIPKKAPQPVAQKEVAPLVNVQSIPDGGEGKSELERDTLAKQKTERKTKRESRWDKEEEREGGSLLPPMLQHRDARRSPSGYPYPPAGRRERQSLLGTGPAMPPLQNTVIVQQQPGQSVYVQQQLFPAPPAPQVQAMAAGPPPVMQTQFLPASSTPATPLIVHQHTIPSLQPLPPPGSLPQPAVLHYPVVQGHAGAPPLLSTTIPPLPVALPAPPTTLPTLPTLPISTQPSAAPAHLLTQQPVNMAGGITSYQLAPLPPPPPTEEEEEGLASGWKSAKDHSGKVYYYHLATRKTQWERPVEKSEEGELMMELATPDHSTSDEGEEVEEEEEEEQKEKEDEGQPHTPEDSPPPSPSPSLDSEQDSRSSPGGAAVGEEEREHTFTSAPSTRHPSAKDQFRHALSQVVVRCLDHHRKPDCKYGRITCSEDFKYLARKLTHGLTEKEVGRRGGASKLVFTASVKSRAKEYIHSYMKKFGPVFKRI